MNYLGDSLMNKVVCPGEVTAAECTCYKLSPCKAECLRAAGPKWRMDVTLSLVNLLSVACA